MNTETDKQDVPRIEDTTYTFDHLVIDGKDYHNMTEEDWYGEE